MDFLYGRRCVMAAIQSGQRQFGVLYALRDGLNAVETSLVNSRRIRVEYVGVDRLNQLSKQSKHQGMVLKCGTRPIPAVHALPTVMAKRMSAEAMTRDKLPTLQANDVKAALESWLQDDNDDDDGGKEEDTQTAEERWRAIVDSTTLALYRIQDPQNLGAILRSSFFFGVDQVILSEPRSGVLSRITPAVSSASAGAAEHVNIAQAVSLEQLLEEAPAAGYDVIGTAMASGQDARYVPHHRLAQTSPQRPKILVLGNEHDGLPPHILSKCTMITSISSRCGPPSLKGHNLDSLNVSVAAGILLSSLISSGRHS